MKPIQFAPLVMLQFLAFAAIASPPPPGGDISGGGDAYAEEFISIGREVADRLAAIPLAEVTSAQILAAVRTTTIQSKESLTREGALVDAINYPAQKRIEISRSSWDGFDEHYKKVFLVFHEYLGILGIDDHDYEVSSRIDDANVCRRSPLMKKYIEDQVRKSCFRIVKDDLRFFRSLEVDPYEIFDVSSGEILPLSELRANDFRYFAEAANVGVEYVESETLPTGIFMDLKSTIDMSFFNSKFKKIMPGAFRGMRALKSLTFKYGPVGELFAGSFEGMPMLESLHLETTATSLPTGAFKGLRSLKKLVLPNTPPVDLAAGSFEDLRNLVSIEVNDTQIDTIKTGAFRGLDQMTSMELISRHSEIAYIEAGVFETMPRLEQLAIRMSPNGRGHPALDREVFRGAEGIKKLTLAGGETFYGGPVLDERFEPDFLQLLSNLNYLNLSCLHLNRVPRGWLDRLPAGGQLVLNPKQAADIGQSYPHLKIHADELRCRPWTDNFHDYFRPSPPFPFPAPGSVS